MNQVVSENIVEGLYWHEVNKVEKNDILFGGRVEQERLWTILKERTFEEKKVEEILNILSWSILFFSC